MCIFSVMYNINRQSSLNACYFIAIYTHAINLGFNDIDGSGHHVSKTLNCVFSSILQENLCTKIIFNHVY